MRGSTGNASPFCLFCGQRGAIDALLNVLLFVPLGAGLRMAGLRFRTAVLASLAATILVEVLQVGAVPGRDASTGDIVWNTAGGALGAWLAGRWRAWLAPLPADAERLARGAALLLPLFVLAGGVLLLPADPGEGRYFSQWRPPDAHSSAQHGIVVDAHWNGVPIPNGELDRPALLRERTIADGLHVRAGIVPLARERWLIGALAAVEHPRRPLWAIRIGSGSVSLWSRSRADDWRFRTPALVLPVGAAVAAEGARGRPGSALAWRAGDTLRIDARRDRGTYDVRIAVRDVERRFVHRVSPTRGVLAIAPLDFTAGDSSDPLTLIALALLVAPLGWWTAAAAVDARRRARAVAMAAASLLVALVAIPLALRLALPPPVEWAAALGGLILAALAGRLAARHAAPPAARARHNPDGERARERRA